jgi:hypothetical protein
VCVYSISSTYWKAAIISETEAPLVWAGSPRCRVHNFFWDLKKYGFSAQNLKSYLSFFIKKMFVRNENWPEIHISCCESYLLPRLDITVLYIIFSGFENIEFYLKTRRDYPSVLPKNVCSWWKRIENPYFLSTRVIFSSFRRYRVVHIF